MKSFPSDVSLKEITKVYDHRYFCWDGKGEAIGYQGIYTFFLWHRIFADKILELKPKSFLELGCAYGHIVKLVENEGIFSVGVDVSKFAMGMRVTNSLVRASVTHLPFKNEAFDLGFCSELMEHIPEPYVDQALDEIARVCKRCWFGIAYQEIDEYIWGKGGKRELTHVTIKPFNWWQDKFKKYNGRLWQFKKNTAGLPEDVVSYSIPEGKERTALNIGCFLNMFPNTPKTKWINVDILDLTGHAKQNGLNFMQHNATKPLPFQDNTIQWIVAYHFLEHLTPEEAEAFLKECKRVLKPEGTLRISVPDSEKLMRKYDEGTLGDYDFLNVECAKSKNQAGKLWAILLENHKAIYDEEALKQTLEKAGFSNITRQRFNVSSKEKLGKEIFDTHPNLSLVMEAEKPVQVVTPHKERLRVALISTSYITTPPIDQYGGLEQVAADLVVALSQLGHDVTLFAAKGSKLMGDYKIFETIEPVPDFGVNWNKINWYDYEKRAYLTFKDKLSEFDIIHDHTWWGFPYLAKMENPSLHVTHTHHGGWLAKTKPPRIDKMNLIAISKFMADVYTAQGFPAKYVYNGINLEAYPFSSKHGNRLAYLGRFVSFKQCDVTVKVAQKLGLGLDLIGGASEKQYFEEKVKPYVDGEKIKLHWKATHEEKVQILQNAKALLFPSKMCIPEGFDVLTELTTKDIKCVRVSDTVFSHDGEWYKVVEITDRQYNGNIITITPYLLNLPLTLTPNHRVFSAHRSKTWASRMTPSIVRNQPNSIKINDPDWIACHKLNQGDFIVIPIPSSKNVDFLTLSDYVNKTEIMETDAGMLYTTYFNKLVQKRTNHVSNPIRNRVEVTPEFLRLLGYYVAEGSSAGLQIRFNFGENDAELITDAKNTIQKLNLSYTLYGETHHCVPLVINSVILKKVFENWFGVGAKNKRLPRWLFELPPAKLWSFIKGIWLGDGCKRKGNGYDYFEYSTASKTLALQLWLILLKAGIIAQFTKKIQGPKAFGYGNPIYRLTITGRYVQIMADAFGITLSGRKRVKTWQMGFFYKGYTYLPIRKIEKKPFKGTVYNLEVDKSTSFLCEGLIVHNSEPFGLCAVEGMSCGTPVLALNDGAIPEVVKEGGVVCDVYDVNFTENGPVVNVKRNPVEAMVEAIPKLDSIKPKDCRRNAEKFDRSIMAKNYIRLYKRILEENEW